MKKQLITPLCFACILSFISPVSADYVSDSNLKKAGCALVDAHLDVELPCVKAGNDYYTAELLVDKVGGNYDWQAQAITPTSWDDVDSFCTNVGDTLSLSMPCAVYQDACYQVAMTNKSANGNDIRFSLDTLLPTECPDYCAGHETVTYNDLTWQQAKGCGKTWQNAVDYCETLSMNGLNDWRLPSKDELKGLVVCTNGVNTPLADNTKCSYTGNYTFDTPTIDQTFKAEDSTYWSSTEGSGLYWQVDFLSGSASKHNPTQSGFVRCVHE